MPNSTGPWPSARKYGYSGGLVPPRVETEPVRVAACQVSLRIGEPGQNRAAAAAAVTGAAASGARIVVLPELTPSGYVFADPAEARSLSRACRRADLR